MEGSYIIFEAGQIRQATNDGMELLGHFLLSQVGAKANFFIDFLKDPRNHSISSGPYFLKTNGDSFVLEHLENEWVIAFETSSKNMLEIIKHWEGICKDPVSSACNLTGHGMVIKRSADGKTFSFETLA